METLLLTSALVSSASLLAWVWLVMARGQFWRTDQRLHARLRTGEDSVRPAVSAVVPARNEVGVIPRTLPTLLRQDYPGLFHVFLVDDRSEDGTSDAARQAALDADAADRLTVIEAEPLPPGWTGKLWALRQGVLASEVTGSEFLLLTDADILHSPGSLRALAHKAQSDGLDLVSLMARLRAQAPWERLLIPAFVYFFAKLYPFRWANDPRRSTAAAAGGCVLVRRDALRRAGGFEAIAGELIDDCALAGRIKRHGRPRGGRIWLGLTQDVRSLRAYSTLGPIWNMVARTAFSQLGFSFWLLAGTVLGMLFLYLVPPLSALGGLAVAAVNQDGVGMWLAATGATAWALLAASYVPMLRWHAAPPILAPLLPVAAMLYTLMTVDSALRWRRGKGGAWKGRTYEAGRLTGSE